MILIPEKVKLVEVSTLEEQERFIQVDNNLCPLGEIDNRDDDEWSRSSFMTAPEVPDRR